MNDRDTTKPTSEMINLSVHKPGQLSGGAEYLDSTVACKL